MVEKTAEYCLLSIQWWPACMSKGEWANWAQAVFSVLAIVGAFLVANKSIRHSQEIIDLQHAGRIAELFAPPIVLTDSFVSTSKELRRRMAVRAMEKLQAAPAPVPPGESFVPREILARLETLKAAFDDGPKRRWRNTRSRDSHRNAMGAYRNPDIH
jgi:hypothetical protein